jgi:hypothetical protein
MIYLVVPTCSVVQVLSVEKEYISSAIDHIHLMYGGVDKYLQSCGVRTDVQEAVKRLLRCGPGGRNHADNGDV